MSERNDRLQRLAAHIADDRPIDWIEDAGMTLAGDPAARGLRELEQVAQGFRHIQLTGGASLSGSCRFRFGPLRVLELLGRGGQGEVWRAYDPMLDLQVALKLRRMESDTLGHEFLEEARRLARVRHANIVSVYGAAVEEGRAGIWMELVRGTTLAELLASHGPFPAEEVRALGLDLCHTLAAVHRHGLLHGDIKPENIMREVSGRIVLMDFGVALELDNEPSLTVSGSPNYLAPEVLQGDPRSVASDVYALGAVLYRLLTGRHPRDADDGTGGPGKAGDRGAQARLSALRAGLPADLIRAVGRALDPLPQCRHAHAQAFAAALSGRPVTKFRYLIAAAAVLLAMALGIASWALHRAVPGAGWQTEAHFYRLDGQGDRELLGGTAIALGERLVLRFRSNRPAYVYVFDDDGSDQAAVLFPLAGLKPGNPLSADAMHQLPGSSAGIPLSWLVSRASRRDLFVVLAADTPQPMIERRISDWRHVQRGAESGERSVFDVVPAPREERIGNVRLRALLRDTEAASGEGHLRRWTFNFTHGTD